MEIKLSSNPDYHPIMQADPSVQMPSCLDWVEIRVTPVRIVFSPEGGNQREGCIDPFQILQKICLYYQYDSQVVYCYVFGIYCEIIDLTHIYQG